MKKDVYLKVVLTVIAICLIWICIREIPITPKLYAETAGSLPETIGVNIESCEGSAFYYAEPIQVEVSNASEIAQEISMLLTK